MKKIILTADDLGISKEANEAILESMNEGSLTSTCIMTNMDDYPHAVEIIKKINNPDICMHLNIIEGKPLLNQENSPLVDKNGYFNNSFIQMLVNSFNKKYMEYVEHELTAQIEKAINDGIKLSSINSHVHVHSIPKLFELTCRLAQKYNIKYVRTQSEPFYIVKNLQRHLNIAYFVNIIKHILLNFFSFINKQTLKKYDLKTNEEFLGVLYTANMDENTIIEGIKRIKDNKICEIILHPTTNKTREKNYIEYLTVKTKVLQEEAKDTEFINWQNIS